MSVAGYTGDVTVVVKQLGHSFGDVVALRDINVEVGGGARAEGPEISAAGEGIPGRGGITAVLGPNASGKSTLLRCVIGAVRPSAGAVLIDGRPAHRIHPYHLAQRIAYVPQRSVVSASFTVREVVELGRYALPADHEAVDAAIARLDLTELVDRQYAALSVGQQQRVTLARAVAQLGGGMAEKSKNQKIEKSTSQQTAKSSIAAPSPSHRGILVLDEPMSAMDLRYVRDCSALLRELADSGVTVLIAMHDLSLACRLADEAWLLCDGRLVAHGAVGDVLEIERLREVFDVEFEWAKDSRGERVLCSAVV